MGITVLAGGFAKHVGHSARTALRIADAGEKAKATFAEIIPATNVPWPPFDRFAQPRPSATKSTQPTTEPSSEMWGNPGRIPESMTATTTPAPVNPSACSEDAL